MTDIQPKNVVTSDNYNFKTLTYSTVLKFLVGPDKIRQVEVYPSFDGIPSPIPAGYQKHIETVANSCAFNTAISGVAGILNIEITVICKSMFQV